MRWGKDHIAKCLLPILFLEKNVQMFKSFKVTQSPMISKVSLRNGSMILKQVLKFCWVPTINMTLFQAM